MTLPAWRQRGPLSWPKRRSAPQAKAARKASAASAAMPATLAHLAAKDRKGQVVPQALKAFWAQEA
jgi:hypothetical protein